MQLLRFLSVMTIAYQLTTSSNVGLARVSRKFCSNFLACILATQMNSDIPKALAEVPKTEKMFSIEDKEFASIVKDDITVRQALITADFTRPIYAEDCTFTDEIDTYTIDKYISGTKALFNAALSHVDLVGNVDVGPSKAQFRFSEKLSFNIPFHPYVLLTGRVELTRGSDGLIHKSREYWDKTPLEVVSQVKFE